MGLKLDLWSGQETLHSATARLRRFWKGSLESACSFVGLVVLLTHFGWQSAEAYDPFAPAPDPAVCSLDYVLPGDLPQPIPAEATSSDFMQFAWRSFLALNAPEVGGEISVEGDNRTQWSRWSSTADLLNQREPGPSGSRYYPPACRRVRGHRRFRALQQVGKVDDSFFEATTGGLSDDPVIDQNGNFVRYEILLSPATYNEIVETQLYKREVLLGLTEDVNLQCGDVTYVGGDPADPRSGSMVVKAAWMEAEGLSRSEKTEYHTERLLVFNPGYRNSTGEDTCELKEMALVGAHVGRKTLRQPNWTWATWEHQNNAPDCTEQMPLAVNDAGRVVPGASKPNQSCPTEDMGEYAFSGAECLDSDACNACNATFSTGNAPSEDECVNPFTPEGLRWCLDLPPSAVAGKSQICRQVPTRSGSCTGDARTLCDTDADCSVAGGVCVDQYESVNQWNVACQDLINQGGGDSVWSRYELIGIQWLAKSFSECANVQSSVVSGGRVDTSLLRDSVQLHGSFGESQYARPILGNTSMESYERANCSGCHAKAYLPGVCSNDPAQSCDSFRDCSGKATCAQFSTDFMYWLALEAAAPPDVRFEGGRFIPSGPLGRRQAFRWRWSSAKPIEYVPERRGGDDPRCLDDPRGTVKAAVRVFDNATGLDSGEIELPCQHWRALKGAKGFRYRDPAGLCDSVLIRKGRRLRVRCRDPRLLDLDESGGDGFETVVRIGRTRLCGRFGRSTEQPSLFEADRRLGLSADCPVPHGILGPMDALTEGVSGPEDAFGSR